MGFLWCATALIIYVAWSKAPDDFWGRYRWIGAFVSLGAPLYFSQRVLGVTAWLAGTYVDETTSRSARLFTDVAAGVQYMLGLYFAFSL